MQDPCNAKTHPSDLSSIIPNLVSHHSHRYSFPNSVPSHRRCGPPANSESHSSVHPLRQPPPTHLEPCLTPRTMPNGDDENRPIPELYHQQDTRLPRRAGFDTTGLFPCPPTDTPRSPIRVCTCLLIHSLTHSSIHSPTAGGLQDCVPHKPYIPYLPTSLPPLPVPLPNPPHTSPYLPQYRSSPSPTASYKERAEHTMEERVENATGSVCAAEDRWSEPKRR